MLLNDLKIPIVRFTNGVDNNNLAKSPFMYIHFNNSVEQDRKIAQHKNPAIMIIKWATPLKSNVVDSLSRTTQSKWTNNVTQYYSTQVVGDIDIVKFNFD